MEYITHTHLHHFEPDDICNNSLYGINKKYIDENNPYIKWVLDNHKAHHYYKGTEKGNYNIIYPGADYILGTHNVLPNKIT